MHGYWDRHARQTNEDPVNPPHLQVGPRGPTMIGALQICRGRLTKAVTIADQCGKMVSHGDSREPQESGTPACWPENNWPGSFKHSPWASYCRKFLFEIAAHQTVTVFAIPKLS